MTKYIHYTNYKMGDLLVSDKVKEEDYTLFIEFDCENAEEIIREAVSAYRMKSESNVIKGESSLFFRRVLCMEMTEIESNLKIPYTMRIHHGDYVAVYSRNIES